MPIVMGSGIELIALAGGPRSLIQDQNNRLHLKDAVTGAEEWTRPSPRKRRPAGRTNSTTTPSTSPGPAAAADPRRSVREATSSSAETERPMVVAASRWTRRRPSPTADSIADTRSPKRRRAKRTTCPAPSSAGTVSRPSGCPRRPRPRLGERLGLGGAGRGARPGRAPTCHRRPGRCRRHRAERGGTCTTQAAWLKLPNAPGTSPPERGQPFGLSTA